MKSPLKLLLISIVSGLSFCENDHDSFYSDLISQNYPLSPKTVSEMNGIRKLTKIISKINDYYNQQNKSSINPNYVQRSGFSFVINSLFKILDIVGFRNLFLSVRDGMSSAITCLSCHSLSTLIFNDIVSRETMSVAFQEACIVLHLSTPRVCTGLIDQMDDHVDFIRKSAKLKPTEICGILMGSQCFIGRSEHLYWKVDIPKKSNLRYSSDNSPGSNNSLTKVEESDKLKILHLTDIHLDLSYQWGSAPKCDEPLCCRNINTKRNESAGRWGAYPCDIPFETVDNSLRQISANTKDIDLWYWTGDIVAHDIWQYSRNTSLRHSSLITQMLTKYSKGKLVVPVIGNHETVPVNCFPPPSVNNSYSISWLYNDLAKQWSHWLPESALKLFRVAGYYTIVIKSGFRVIAVNTNYCARLNIWTYYDSIDPADQLKWLINELLIAEEAGDLVHIVGHVPVDNRECTQAWVQNYLAIIERFSDIIVGQFFGHTHADEFRVLYSNDNYTKPIGFEIVSPSLTTFEHFNPSYRIVWLHSNGMIADIETYFLNLTEANLMTESGTGEPKWHFEYSMADRYSLQNFTHFEFDRLINRLMTNDTDLHTFYLNYYRFSDSLTNDFCDERCKNKFLNDIIIGNPYQHNPKSVLQRG